MSRRLINYRSRTTRSFRQDLPELKERQPMTFSATPMSARAPRQPASTAVYGRRLAEATAVRTTRTLVTA